MSDITNTGSYSARPLMTYDLADASQLDKKWFGNYGITTDELKALITNHPNDNLALFEDNKLIGFATFEILENTMPRDYIGTIKVGGKVIFIHQFTTLTNYMVGNWTADELLLSKIENKAQEYKCKEIWEALSIGHPYSKTMNPNHDAYGFYTLNGFYLDKEFSLAWKPSNNSSPIPCFLFRKNLN